MENFMNKLFKSDKLLEDKKLNNKIENIFENKIFQKIVEQTDVLKDEELSMSLSKVNDQDILSTSLLNSIIIEQLNQVEKQENQNKEKQERIIKLNQHFKKKNFQEENVSQKNIQNQSSQNILNELTNQFQQFEQEIPSEITQSEIQTEFETSIHQKNENQQELSDHYDDESDEGFEIIEIDPEEQSLILQIIQQYKLKNRLTKNNNLTKNDYLKSKYQQVLINDEKEFYKYLPTHLKHPKSTEQNFPVKSDNSIYDCLNLKIYFDRERTGFEERKEFPIIIDSIIAGKYKIKEFLGAATFSKVIHVKDIHTEKHYCLKIIENNKDYIDQSIDEIKILRFIKENGNLDKKFILKLYDYFYYKEHLFLVTELLKDNLYDYLKYNIEQENEIYFTTERLKILTYQMLKALQYLHSLHLIHCDIKPENIMVKSYSNSWFKLIDFGSCCFVHDHLSSYVQSRFYRAPEVILGCKYDYKIDLWSLGCVLVELFTGKVIFDGTDIQEVLVRIQSIIGPFPEWMIKDGKLVNRYFTRQNVIFKQQKNQVEEFLLLIPKQTSLKHRLKTDDTLFLDFVSKLLQIDPNERYNAEQALEHPWIKFIKQLFLINLYKNKNHQINSKICGYLKLQMEQNNNTLNKTQDIKRGKETRLNQVEQELEQEVEEREREFLNDENDEFIERDIEQVDMDDMKKNRNRNKKIKLNQEVKNFDNKKFDEQTKKLLGEVISKQKLDKISKIASNLKQKHNEKQSLMKKNTTHIIKEQLRFKNLDKQIIEDINFLQNKKQDYLQFFILEAVQNQFKKDIIYLFGKVKGQQGYVNSCVTVTGIKREIYIMPKKGHNIKDVEEEIRGLIQAHPKDKKINIDYEIVKKKYCFELNVDYRNEEVEVLKLSYPFNHSELKWLKQEGINFKGVFGNSYKPLDLFFLQTKIKGSEWIKISNFKIDRQQKQEKYFNIIVEDYINQLQNLLEIRDPPTVNVAVINLKKSEDKKKIEEIYFSMYNNFNIVKNTFQTSDNFIFRVSGTESIQKKSDQNNGYHLKECDSEHGLMTQFENYFQNADPDIILGHEILSSVLEFYIRRTKELCKDQYVFSRLAKERQMKTINSLKFQLKQVFGGRLIMDLFELSKNLIKLNSYAFDDMILHFFPKNISLTNDTTNKLEQNFLLLKIVLKLKIFQLTLQLSQVSGSLWEVSLRQARSQRNEILLSHEFSQQNYILPDNLEYGSKQNSSGYSGGKVFEPEIGFYESYIVLVDFNSLYPSIIRQYNICFSTVKRELIEPGDQVTKIDEDLGEDDPLQHVNVSDKKPILPQILTSLIDKRKAVKNEILRQKKQKSLDKEKEQQLDIQQNALKIMANSIYGCLGFSSSRFYAKKIAMLITAFGRKLLESSRELVEKLGYNVIYGDTDSIMINTMKGNIKEAVINGIEIKKEINQQYKTGKGKAILEVEIDGLFKKLLLLKKKKYAGLKVKNYSDIGKSNFHEQLEMEYKGLDLVRRDWSLLTKQVCIKVLDILMSEQGIDGIFNYLKDVNTALDNFTGSFTFIPQDQSQDKSQNSSIIFNINHFKIQKQLQKKTSQYNEQGLPHIKVAIDMQRLFQKTDNELVGHYIPYVIVEGSGSQAQKAFHPSEYLQSLSSETPMKIDIEFYKKNQLLNPLERLIHIIEGFQIEQMNKIFGIENVQNEIVQDNQYDDNERIALKNLPKYFKDFHLDVDDYKNQCFCEKGQQQKCYVFLKCEKQEFLNKLTHVLRNLIRKYGMPYYKCDCGYEIRRVMFQKTCPFCERKDLKDQTDSKLLVAKLLFLKELIKVYSESSTKLNQQLNIEKQISQQMISDIHKILNNISFEKKNVLLPLERYTQFVKDNLTVKLFKQLFVNILFFLKILLFFGFVFQLIYNVQNIRIIL